MNFLYLSPAKMMGLMGAVSGGAAATYEDDWLVDALPNRPVRATGANPTWVVTGASVPVNFISLHGAQLTVGATITGHSLVMTHPAYAGRVPINPWQANVVGGVLQAGSSTGSVSFVFAGNAVNPAIVGHAFCGQALELERPIMPGGQRSHLRFTVQPDDGQLGNIRAFRRDKSARRFNGSQVLTQAGLDAVMAWFDSTDDGYLPSVIVPDPTLNDAWTVLFEGEPSYAKHAWGFEVTLALVEYPRRRWVA